jgi:tetratricopeptide (TPR) repeat protein
MKRLSAESPTIRSYRELLGVGPGAGGEDLKKAYHRMALMYHPDRNPLATAAEEFQKIRQAFKVLSDSVQVRAMNHSHLRERLFNNIIEGLNISFGSFFGYREFAPYGSRVQRRLRLGREKEGESDADEFEKLAGALERDCAILDNPAYDAIEIVYAGKFSVGDEERLLSGLAGSHITGLPWVVLNNQGILHFLEGNIKQALKCYVELNERIPNNIIFMYRQGLCHVIQGFKEPGRGFLGFKKPDRKEIEKGILLFRKCIALGQSRSIGKQNCILIRKFLADTLDRIGSKRGAARIWREILRLEPRSIEAAFRTKGPACARELVRGRHRLRRQPSGDLPQRRALRASTQGK